MKLIVWLGNPWKQYENTRHNVGFFCIERLREAWDFPLFQDSRFSWMLSEGVHDGEKYILLKPMTYMNLSGSSIQGVLHFYKMDAKNDLLVFSDDLDMDFGKVRLRTEWSHGGQNGLKNIIQHIGHAEFARIKIGIGRDPAYEVSDWVLSVFTKTERESLEKTVWDQVTAKIEEWRKRNWQ